jgi:hypothetical protein
LVSGGLAHPTGFPAAGEVMIQWPENLLPEILKEPGLKLIGCFSSSV